MVDADELSCQLQALRFARYRLQFVAATPLHLPAYKGSTFRGGFGMAFKELACIRRDRDCDHCLIRDRCVYQYVFETPAVRNTRNYSFAPHPFVIEPPAEGRQSYEPGQPLGVGLVLVGAALSHLPYFIYAFEEMGRRGLGRGRGRVQLERVEAWTGSSWPVVYRSDSGALSTDLPVLCGAPAAWPWSGRAGVPALSGPPGGAAATDAGTPAAASSRQAGTVSLQFCTPTRFRSGGQLEHALPFALLARGLLRRAADLLQFHCDAALELDFRAWAQAAEKVRTGAQQLHWLDWERYSRRQETRMKLGGLVGEVEYAGPWEPFEPLLRLGAAVHVGKGTAFGLGQYAIVEQEGSA